MQKRLNKVSLLIILLFSCCILTIKVRADTIYNSPYVQFSPDSEGWTTNADDKNVEWYDDGTTIITGVTSSLRALNTGEHYYKKARDGVVPVGKWTVEWSHHTCIHNSYPKNGTFLNLNFTTNGGCKVKLYSGWVATCADCEESFTPFIYMSRQAATSISYIDTSKKYYSICPFDKNLEQGVKIDHKCKAISFNKYLIKYLKNGTSVGSYMSPTIHMYNNATVYEGEEITPDTKLRKNTYVRPGYEFVGWNTKSDGSGTAYSDAQAIFNLTSQNYDNHGSGTISLYAQWKSTTSTLQIDPAGGTYQGKSGITTISKGFGTEYSVLSPVPPNGVTVTFDTQGGNSISPITGTMTFKEWVQGSSFNGIFQKNKYTFQGSQGHTDRLTATYEPNSITLPLPTKANSSFAGWYYEPAGINLAGYAGDRIKPSSNIILYAKWVSLILTSTNNMTAKFGKGAVDLVWTQPDMKDKTYTIYQRQKGGTWSKISSAKESGVMVSENFVYSGKSQTYTIPYSGIYQLTASGSQGGNYGTFSGGKGGKVSGKFWLEKGEILTYNIGSQSGYNGGGKGTSYGNGGGYTIVSSDKKEDLLIAGGGGGASPAGDGGEGGSLASVTDSKTGQEGMAGGGGGYKGGTKGEDVRHYHIDTCKHTENLDYTLYKIATGGQEEIRNPMPTDAFNAVEGNYNAAVTKPEEDKGISITSISDDGLKLHLSTGSVPTNGNTTMNLHLCMDCWEGFNEYDSSNLIDFTIWDYSNHYVEVFDQNGTSLFKKTLKDIWNIQSDGELGSISGYWEWDGINVKEKFFFNESLTLPEGTTSVRVYATFISKRSHCGINLRELSFSGGKKTTLICEYKDKEDGYVISSKPAYGGSNYINTDYASDYTSESGKKTFDGSFSLEAKELGYELENKLKNVPAPDLAPPNAPVLKRKADGKDHFKVSWDKPEDNGTVYEHQVFSYVINKNGTLGTGLTSNITQNTLTTGVKNYRYFLSTIKGGGGVPSTSWQALSDSTITVALKDQVQYLHVVAEDGAGNFSKVVIQEIPKKDDPKLEIDYAVYTNSITIPDVATADNIYQSSSKTYYVRADGETPFPLEFSGYIDGKATAAYQVNLLSYEISGYTGIEKFNIDIPNAHTTITNQELSYTSELNKEILAPDYLLDAAYTEAVRTNQLKDVQLTQKFTADTKWNGQTIQVTPRCAAIRETKSGSTWIRTDQYTWSDSAIDSTHGLTLILDGEAPTILGTDCLVGLKKIDKDMGELLLPLEAKDGLSGLRSLEVFIQNTDNYRDKTYVADSSGELIINLTQEDYLFNGDFTITITAIDNVGNKAVETYDITEFSLQVSLERMLAPHTPAKFKCGESGILHITTTGYADKVQVVFPDILPGLDKTYTYDVPSYLQKEELEFMIPLDTSEGDYNIHVYAYKKGRMLKESPNAAIINGTVLDDIRTRLR